MADDCFIQERAVECERRLAAELHRYGRVDPAREWAFKDPRTTLTLRVWRSLYPDLRLIEVVRHGFDVALSLSRRERREYVRRSPGNRLFPPTTVRAYGLWATYVQAAEENSRGHLARLRVRYEDLTSSPDVQVRELANFLATKPANSAVEKAVARCRPPRRRSTVDRIKLRALTAVGALDPRPLAQLGYRA